MMMNDEQMARGLGLFSIGLGLAEVASPDALARAIGVADDDATRVALRAAGLREIANGVALLTRPRPAGWLWARVGGDAMDLALVGVALAAHADRRGRVIAAATGLVGVTALDVWASLRHGRRPSRVGGRRRQDIEEDHGMDVKRAITVNRPPEELYQFWHDFENLPRFMEHLESVQTTGPGRSHWTAQGPAGTTVEWDAEVVDDRPNELIAWRSLDGAAVDNAGSVRFAPAPGGRGTEVHVTLRYDPPGGALGATVAKLFGEDPTQQVPDDLRHFKQVMETGELTQSDATAKGGGAARPPADAPHD